MTLIRNRYLHSRKDVLSAAIVEIEIKPNEFLDHMVTIPELQPVPF